MNQYETVFIMTPDLSDEQMKEAVKKYRNLLVEQGAEIVYEDNWGLNMLSLTTKRSMPRNSKKRVNNLKTSKSDGSR